MFHLRTRRERNSLEVDVEGSLDGRTGRHLVDLVQQLTSPGDTVTIDITEVSHMDSAGAEAVSTAASVISSAGSTTALDVGDARFAGLLEPFGFPAPSTQAALTQNGYDQDRGISR